MFVVVAASAVVVGGGVGSVGGVGGDNDNDTCFDLLRSTMFSHNARTCLLFCVLSKSRFCSYEVLTRHRRYVLHKLMSLSV